MYPTLVVDSLSLLGYSWDMADLLRLEYIPLAQAVLWDGNPKKHDIGAISESIQRYGYKDPAKFEPSLNDGKGALVEGNGRTHALQMMHRQKMERPRGVGLVEETGEWAVPVLFGVDAESEAVARAYAIDHNSLVLAGSDMSALDITRMWDDTLYAQVLTELASADELPVSVDGDDLDLILEMLAQRADEPPEDPGTKVDKAEELQEKWKVELGQMWTIGEHAIICGDCREADTWRKLLKAAGVNKVNGVFTSPPYAMQRAKQYGGVPANEYVDWWEAVQENVKGNLADDGSFFVNIKPHCENGERVLYVFDLVLAMRRRWGWRFVDELCWKRITSPGRWTNRFKNLFEPVYHFSLDAACRFRPRNVLQEFKGDPSGYFSYDQATAERERPSGFDTVGSMKSPHFDGALPGNFIEASGAGGDGHWGAFPISLPDFFVRAYSDPGDVWVDPFCGSGTVLAACENEGRKGLGIEVLPKYCAVILQRLTDLGLSPVLLKD